jgi:hypothetical protein
VRKAALVAVGGGIEHRGITLVSSNAFKGTLTTESGCEREFIQPRGQRRAHLDVLEGDAATALAFPLFEADSGMHRPALAGEPLEEGSLIRGRSRA